MTSKKNSSHKWVEIFWISEILILIIHLVPRDFTEDIEYSNWVAWSLVVLRFLISNRIVLHISRNVKVYSSIEPSSLFILHLFRLFGGRENFNGIFENYSNVWNFFDPFHWNGLNTELCTKCSSDNVCSGATITTWPGLVTGFSGL